MWMWSGFARWRSDLPEMQRMPLSAAAEAKISALVTSGISFTLHVADSDHFDEDSAYHSASTFGKGAHGMGPCSFFAHSDDRPGGHRTSPTKIVKPGAFSNKDAEGYTLLGKNLQAARK